MYDSNVQVVWWRRQRAVSLWWMWNMQVWYDGVLWAMFLFYVCYSSFPIIGFLELYLRCHIKQIGLCLRENACYILPKKNLVFTSIVYKSPCLWIVVSCSAVVAISCLRLKLPTLLVLLELWFKSDIAILIIEKLNSSSPLELVLLGLWFKFDIFVILRLKSN